MIHQRRCQSNKNGSVMLVATEGDVNTCNYNFVQAFTTVLL
jgi:hypothetical protein